MIYVVEGGSVLMCYIFDSLIQNRIIRLNDKITLFVLTFKPFSTEEITK